MSTSKILISYSHDSELHAKRVLALADKFCKDGIDTQLDQYINGTPAEGWPQWMTRTINEVDFVVVICTPTYYRRMMGLEKQYIGKGVKWEALLTLQTIYDNDSKNPKFIPLLFNDGRYEFIPEALRSVTHYQITDDAQCQIKHDEQYIELYRYLTFQPKVIKPAIGKQLKLPVENAVKVQNNEVASGSSTRNFFIAYAHSDVASRQLAPELNQLLIEAGHQSFIDLDITAGSKWIEVIDKAIKDADCMVVLLCEATMDSEAVQAEVRLAYNMNKIIVPVRVDYMGMLDYELEIYLGRLQFIAWRNTNDTETLTNTIIDAAIKNKVYERRPAYWQHDAQGGRLTTDINKPKSSADARNVYGPADGTIKPQDPCYLNRDADQEVINLAAKTGQTIVIKAPHQMGKSSLLMQYLQACRDHNKNIVLIDFNLFSEEDFADFSLFLTIIVEIIHHALRIDGEFSTEIKNQRKTTWHIEREFISAIEGPLVIAFDEVDRVLGKPNQDNFCAMLRGWHNKRANSDSLWENVDLAFVISTEPKFFIKDPEQSPFNVGIPLFLNGFDLEHYQQLNETMNAELSQQELEQLHQLLGGHPYLTRLAFYHLIQAGTLNFASFIETATNEQGIFGGHLRNLMARLYPNPKLLNALRKIIRGKSNIGRDCFYRLKAVGLVNGTEHKAHPSNLLYARFFKDFSS